MSQEPTTNPENNIKEEENPNKINLEKPPEEPKQENQEIQNKNNQIEMRI